MRSETEYKNAQDLLQEVLEDLWDKYVPQVLTEMEARVAESYGHLDMQKIAAEAESVSAFVATAVPALDEIVRARYGIAN